ncbi:MAG: hypothetical protein ABI665_14645 [Vicinamibacterales bacterium]
MGVIYPRQREIRPPHAVSVLVTPVIALGTSSIAAATVLTTLAPHHFVTGDTVAIAGHLGSTPPIDGARIVTVIDAVQFSIPLAVTIAGAGGTVVRTIAVEPLTLVEGKLRAGLDWVGGDPRDALMLGFIAAARSQVETDTGLALLTQTRDVYLDAVSPGAAISVPALCQPLQTVLSITAIDTAGVPQVLDPAQYVVDAASGRIGLALGGAWLTDVRPFQPWVIRLVAGRASVAELQARDPKLVHAVGLLTAHYATLGRDLASTGSAALVPMGYDDAIASYVPVSVI